MRLYTEVARRSFRRYAAYRGATVAGIFTNTVFGFIKAYVLIASAPKVCGRSRSWRPVASPSMTTGSDPDLTTTGRSRRYPPTGGRRVSR